MKDPYDFPRFLERVKDMDYVEMLRYTEEEVLRVEHDSHGVRGAPRRREMGSLIYADRVGEFLFWLRSGIRPANAREDDFQRYRDVAEALVEKGQLKPSVFEMFDEPAR